jgi:dihydrofolate reductase
MRSLTAAAFISLDGVMQAPGGPEEDPSGRFNHGGWVAPFWDGSVEEGMAPLFSGPLDLLLGRRTYDIFAAHWPYRSDAIGEAYNHAAKYVVTSRSGALSWANSHALHDAFDGVARVKAQDGPDLQLWGSSTLYSGLIEHGLLDRLYLMTFPVVLGTGKRLLDGVPAKTMKLITYTGAATGVIIATYEPAGSVRTGSFAAENPSDAELARREALKREG